MELHEWAAKWQISGAALSDLQAAVLGEVGVILDDAPARRPIYTESGAQAAIRIEAAKKGLRLWRNNNGALQATDGRWVRFGLANDSKAVNDKLKSSDLIGIRPVKIGPEWVGFTLGQFVSREVKAPGWKFTGTARETAQKRWIDLIREFGGDAHFATGIGTL